MRLRACTLPCTVGWHALPSSATPRADGMSSQVFLRGHAAPPPPGGNAVDIAGGLRPRRFLLRSWFGAVAPAFRRSARSKAFIPPLLASPLPCPPPLCPRTGTAGRTSPSLFGGLAPGSCNPKSAPRTGLRLARWRPLSQRWEPPMVAALGWVGGGICAGRWYVYCLSHSLSLRSLLNVHTHVRRSTKLVGVAASPSSPSLLLPRLPGTSLLFPRLPPPVHVLSFFLPCRPAVQTASSELDGPAVSGRHAMDVLLVAGIVSARWGYIHDI